MKKSPHFGSLLAIKFPYLLDMTQKSHPVWSTSLPQIPLLLRNDTKTSPIWSPWSHQIPLFSRIGTNKSPHLESLMPSCPHALKFPYFQEWTKKSHPIFESLKLSNSLISQYRHKKVIPFFSPSSLQIPLFSKIGAKRSPHLESLMPSNSVIFKNGHKKVTSY